eukprot:TRINITY_DN23570_c0_g1_i1.p1 TRINITY_DN23570_c0_g1~~TRINITY_DN23570_c0_g1_i1.p1  ORF type:complete len:834 (-),score=140.45 TRINITY_DN23570_c0_g1_i1:637-3138(-)
MVGRWWTVPACECDVDAVGWIQLYFSDCVYSSLEMAGFAIGLSSILFWVFAQLPQFISNIRCQSAEALSPWFLFQWLSGDTLNLLGCILTGDQLPSETYTALYFIFADCCIITQYVYFQIQNRDKVQLEADVCSSAGSSIHNPVRGYLSALTTKYLPAQQQEREKLLLAAPITSSAAASSAQRAMVETDMLDVIVSPRDLVKSPSHARHDRPHHHHYHPITFATGRSGAVMIAHAFQGPHLPLTPPSHAASPHPPGPHKSQPEGAVVNRANSPARPRRPRAPAAVAAQIPAIGERKLARDLQDFKVEKRRRVRIAAKEQSELFPARETDSREQGSDSGEPQQKARGKGALPERPPRSATSSSASSRNGRRLRRIVEELGLEVGAPLHHRLTIHHPHPEETGEPSQADRIAPFLSPHNEETDGADRTGLGGGTGPAGHDNSATSDPHRGGLENAERPRSSSGRLRREEMPAASHVGYDDKWRRQQESTDACLRRCREDSTGDGRGSNGRREEGTAPFNGPEDERRGSYGAAFSAAAAAFAGRAANGAKDRLTSPSRDASDALGASPLPAVTEGDSRREREGQTEEVPAGQARGGARRAMACVAGLLLCSAYWHSGGGLMEWSTGGFFSSLDQDSSSRLAGLTQPFVILYGSDHGSGRKLLQFIGLEGEQGQRRGQWVERATGWVKALGGADAEGRRSPAQLVGRRLLVMCGVTNQSLGLHDLGLLLGWGSACFYLGSRIAQLVKNNQRQSAEGLSRLMFLCAFMANLAYGSAILLRAQGWTELMGKAPWLLGSMGTLSLDISIFAQTVRFRQKEAAAAAELLGDKRAPLLKQVA